MKPPYPIHTVYRISVKTIPFLLAGLLGAASPALADQSIQVVTTLPFLKDFAEVIGKDRVQVKSLMTGLESEHTYTPKPTDVIAVREAAVLIKIGLGLETWINPLIRNAGNPRLLVINTSEGIPLLKDHLEAERHSGGRDDHRHAMGNPHIWLDPANAKTMVRHILDGLTKADPAGRASYQTHFSGYIKKLDELQENGKKRLKSLSDRRIVTHHAAWPYFARRFGLTIEGNLISQVGTEPSARELARLTKKIRSQRIRVIVSEPQLNQTLPTILAQETGARLVILTPLPGAIRGTETYISMIEYNIEQLARGLGQPSSQSEMQK